MEKLTKQQKVIYNDFVQVLNKKNILVHYLEIGTGLSTKGNKTVYLKLDTDLGFTESEATEIFSNFNKKYPNVHIDYNLREKSVLEEMLIDEAESIFSINNVSKLQTIK